MMEVILVPPHAAGETESRKIAAASGSWSQLRWALPPNRRTQEAMRQRVQARLEELIGATCRDLVEQRLSRLAPNARTSILPSDPIRVKLGGKLLATLAPHALVGLLQPADPAERATLMRLIEADDPMVREAALNTLGGVQRDRGLAAMLRDLCLEHLHPGMALLGGEIGSIQPSASPEGDDQLLQPERETRFLRSLRTDEPTTTWQILATHASLTTAHVARLINSRDPLLVVALAWRAGYSMRAATLLQTQLAGIPPGSALTSDETGGPPLERRALAWHLDSLEATNGSPTPFSRP